jgi:HSP20 family protein
VSLPGFARAEVACAVKDDLVSIKAEHEDTAEERAEDYYCRERRQGTVVRSVTLPHAVDADHAEAQYRDGVLTLRAPIKADQATRQIAINED